MKEPDIHSEYLGRVLERKTLWKVIDRTTSLLRQRHIPKFDAIAFTGVSGSLVAPSVAVNLNKHLLAVRKKSEKRHSKCLVEGPLGGCRYIIIDDLIDSGATVRRIIDSIDEEFGPYDFSDDRYVCVGVVEYNTLASAGKGRGDEIPVRPGYDVPILSRKHKFKRYL